MKTIREDFDMKCPWCKSARLDAHFVDVGVGMEQVSPYECFDCGARQISPYDKENMYTKEELEKGFYKGQYDY